MLRTWTKNNVQDMDPKNVKKNNVQDMYPKTSQPKNLNFKKQKHTKKSTPRPPARAQVRGERQPPGKKEIMCILNRSLDTKLFKEASVTL